MYKLFQLFFLLIFMVSIYSFAQEEQIEKLALSSEWKYLTLLDDNTPVPTNLTRFYFSEKRTPLHELKATLKVFRQHLKESDLKEGHPHCRFPARKEFLERHGFKIQSKVNCHGLKQWLSQLSYQDIQLIYASQFLGNPASIMGHTFIKFVDPNVPDFANRTIGYAASVPDNVSAWGYIKGGLFGGFKGVFSSSPYYEKVHEYNNIERRDIWEYTLNLSDKQKELFALRLWELMHNADFDYYFIDENCSYLPLIILQSIFYQKNILSPFFSYVIPLETVKVLKKVGLIKRSFFRPSIRKKLRFKYEKLSETNKSLLISSIQKKSLQSNDVKVLDTLIDYISLKKHLNDGVVPSKLKEMNDRVLSLRAKNKIPPNHSVPLPSDPINGHSPYQLGLSFYQAKEISGIKTKFKPGVHSYTDNDIGYMKNSSFSFFSIESFSDIKTKKTLISDFTLISIQNSSTSMAIDPTLSWFFITSIKKSLANKFLYQTYSNVFAGIGKQLEFNHYYSQLFLTARYRYGDTYFFNEYENIGMKFSFGKNVLSSYKYELSLTYMHSLRKEHELQTRFFYSYFLDKNYSIKFNTKYQKSKYDEDFNQSLGLSYYF